MRRSILFLLTIAILFLFVGCGLIGNDPVHAELRLVPLTTGDLSKVITDEEGNRYLPTTEVANILQKKASADIDFGEMEASKTLQYVLMNVGNTDVYDITFVSQDLKIHPEHIPLVPTPGEGGDLIALPIVSVSKEHVISLSGVGSLLDFEIGEFTDVMTLCYNYDLSQSQSDSTYIGDSLVVTDTVIVENFDIADEYTVAGTKMGAFIDFWMSGVKWQEYVDQFNAGGVEDLTYTYQTIPLISGGRLDLSRADTIIVANTGNVSMRLRVVNSMLPNTYPGHDGIIIDTVLQANTEIDLADVFGYTDNSNEERGDLVLVGSTNDQPYIFTVMDWMCTTGALAIKENFRDYDRIY